MATKRPLRLESEQESPALSDRAIDNLQYIRETMERAGTFTAISGRGIAATGVIAIVAYGVSGNQLGSPRWLSAWVGAALFALVTSIVATYRKARGTSTPISGSLGRKLALAFLPALVAGAVITAVALRAGWFAALPGVWLIMYGAAVMAGGALSAPIVPVMGASFMLLGALALGAPVVLASAWEEASRTALLNVFMALGFGGLHLVFGTAIARRYGG
ncbi:MAG: hypothetical protein ACT4P7_09815 [Gemmatimonadaceae bacterium]